MDWNTDAYNYHGKSDPLYSSIPFSIFINKNEKNEKNEENENKIYYHSIVVDNSGFQKWNFGEKGNIEIISEFIPLRFFIFGSNENSYSVIQLLKTFTGNPDLR
jgi:hypothetical protein